MGDCFERVFKEDIIPYLINRVKFFLKSKADCFVLLILNERYMLLSFLAKAEFQRGLRGFLLLFYT